MGDGTHNTRLRNLDEAVKQLQEESAAHTKALESSINSTLQEPVLQRASPRAPPPTAPHVANPSSSVLGQSSTSQAQTIFSQQPAP